MIFSHRELCFSHKEVDMADSCTTTRGMRRPEGMGWLYERVDNGVRRGGRWGEKGWKIAYEGMGDEA